MDMGCEYYYIVTKLINDGEEKILVHVCNVGFRKNGPPCREVLEARTAFCHPSLKLTETSTNTGYYWVLEQFQNPL